MFLSLAVVLLAFATPAAAGKADNSVRFGWEQTLDSADPWFTTSRLGIILADNVWDTLIYRNPATGEYSGDLATAWRWIDDRTLELDLRRGVKFHNGADFDADDVVYTIGFISRPEINSLQRNYVRWIDHVEKRGAYTVRIFSKKPFPAAVAYLASGMFVIHPHAYYARVGPKGMNGQPVGTGPFRVAEHALGKFLRLERNPDYFRGGPKSLPQIDSVEIRFIPDAQTRVAEMVSHGLDLIMYVTLDQANELRGVPTLQVREGANYRSNYLQMNTTDATPVPQLRDVRVRQAILYAIDREKMAEFLAGGNARVLHAECYPTHFGCDDALVPRYDYDPAKARRLLAEAGYPNGFAMDFYAYNNRNEMDAIIGYLAAVGIRARLRFLAYATVQNAMRTGKAGFVQQAWSGLASDLSDSVARFHEFSANDTNRDPDIRDLLLRGDSSMDPDVRKSAYAKALSLIQERAYIVPLYTKPTFYLAAGGLDFRPPADDTLHFYEMSWK